MTDIADIPFAQVSEEEKKRFDGKIKQEGSWMGYKLREFWVSRCTLTECISRLSMIRRSTTAFATRLSITTVSRNLDLQNCADPESQCTGIFSSSNTQKRCDLSCRNCRRSPSTISTTSSNLYLGE